MGVTIGNPIVITSGTLNTECRGEYMVDRVYWFQPALGSTSNLIITKRTASGVTYLEAQVETSGETQTIDFKNQFWYDPYIRCVPTGTLYIYCR